MSSETEPEARRILTPPVIVLIVLIVAFLFMSLCALSLIFLSRQRSPSPTSQADSSGLNLPVEPVQSSTSGAGFTVHLPVILAGIDPAPALAPATGSTPEQVWIVTKIKSLGYRSGKHRYDLATFRRVGDQASAKGYCINPGWDTPKTGTLYSLTTDDTFVPLQEPQGDPYQRFRRLP